MKPPLISHIGVHIDKHDGIFGIVAFLFAALNI